MDLSASDKDQGALRSGQDKIKRYFESVHSAEYPFRLNQDDIPTLLRSSLDSSIDGKSTSEKNMQQNKFKPFPTALSQAQCQNNTNQKSNNQERILCENASSNNNENNKNFLTLNNPNQKQLSATASDKNNTLNTSNLMIQGSADRNNNNNNLAEESLFLTNRQSNICLSPVNMQTINTRPNRAIEDSLMVLKTQDPPSIQENEDNLNHNSPVHSQEIAINYLAQSKSPLNKNNTNRLEGSSRLNTPKISVGEPQTIPLTHKPSQQSQLDFNNQNNNNSSNASNKRGSCTPQTTELIAKRNASSKSIKIGNHDVKKTKNFFFWSKVNFIKRKFVHTLITRVPSTRFKHLKKEQFRMINDASSDYGYFIHQNPLIFSEKSTFFKKLVYQLRSKITRITRFFVSFLHYLIYQINISDTKINDRVQQIIQGQFILKQESMFKLIWDIFIMLMTFYLIITVPIEHVSKFGQLSQIEFLNRSIIQFFLILDIIINLNSAIYENGVAITNRIKIFKDYFWNLLKDMLVLFVFQYSQNANSDTAQQYLDYIVFFKYLDIPSKLTDIETKLQISSSQLNWLKLIKLECLVLLLAHITCCIFLLIGLQESKSDSWLNKYSYWDLSFGEKYLLSFYYIIITMTTIGYGDITPASQGEKGFMIFVALMATNIFAYTFSQISEIVKNEEAKKQAYNKMMHGINNEMNKRGLSLLLQHKVRKYYEHLQYENEQKQGNRQNIFDTLPTLLKEEVLQDVNAAVIEEIFLLKIFSSECKKMISLAIKQKVFFPEETVFFENETNDCIYYVASGQVELSIPVTIKKDKNKALPNMNILTLQVTSFLEISGEIIVGFFCSQKKSVFGYESFLLGKRNPYSAKSSGVAVLSYIQYKDLIGILADFPLDYERYALTRDEAILNSKTQDLKLCCTSCGDFQHEFRMCPFVNPVVGRPRLSQEEIQVNQRSLHQRKKIPFFKPLYHLVEIQAQAKEIVFELDKEHVIQELLSILDEPNEMGTVVEQDVINQVFEDDNNSSFEVRNDQDLLDNMQKQIGNIPQRIDIFQQNKQKYNNNFSPSGTTSKNNNNFFNGSSNTISPTANLFGNGQNGGKQPSLLPRSALQNGGSCTPVQLNRSNSSNNLNSNIFGLPEERMNSQGEGLFVIQEREDELIRSRVIDYKSTRNNLPSNSRQDPGSDSPTRQRSYSASLAEILSPVRASQALKSNLLVSSTDKQLNKSKIVSSLSSNIIEKKKKLDYSEVILVSQNNLNVVESSISSEIQEDKKHKHKNDKSHQGSDTSIQLDEEIPSDSKRQLRKISQQSENQRPQKPLLTLKDMKKQMEERRKTEDISKYEEIRRFGELHQHSEEINSNKMSLNHNSPWNAPDDPHASNFNNVNNFNIAGNVIVNNNEDPYRKLNSNGSELLNKVFERRAQKARLTLIEERRAINQHTKDNILKVNLQTATLDDICQITSAVSIFRANNLPGNGQSSQLERQNSDKSFKLINLNGINHDNNNSFHHNVQSSGLIQDNNNNKVPNYLIYSNNNNYNSNTNIFNRQNSKKLSVKQHLNSQQGVIINGGGNTPKSYNKSSSFLSQYQKNEQVKQQQDQLNELGKVREMKSNTFSDAQKLDRLNRKLNNIDSTQNISQINPPTRQSSPNSNNNNNNNLANNGGINRAGMLMRQGSDNNLHLTYLNSNPMLSNSNNQLPSSANQLNSNQNNNSIYHNNNNHNANYHNNNNGNVIPQNMLLSGQIDQNFSSEYKIRCMENLKDLDMLICRKNLRLEQEKGLIVNFIMVPDNEYSFDAMHEWQVYYKKQNYQFVLHRYRKVQEEKLMQNKTVKVISAKNVRKSKLNDPLAVGLRNQSQKNMFSSAVQRPSVVFMQQ